MTEQNKAPTTSPEHPYPQPVIQYAQPYNGTYPPPPPPGTAPYPPYFYPPQTEGSHGENGQNGMPPGAYMMLAPPGVVYVHPPPPQGQSFPAPSAAAAASQPAMARPKRKQVKMACTNCAAACKRCDEARPCERCQKYGIAESCVDGQRKERKKGIKRGPYKRKNKAGGDGQSYSGEWAPPPGTQAPPANGTAPAPAIHAVPAQLPPEGYPYPIFYPPPPGAYMAHPTESQPGPEGSPPQPPMMQYYIHPGAAGYAPYAHHYPPMYPHPPGHPAPHPATSPHGPVSGAPPAPPNIINEPPPQTVNPADTSSKKDEGVETNGVDGSTVNGKKRSRSGKSGEARSKRAKPSSGRKDKEGEGEGEAGDSI